MAQQRQPRWWQRRQILWAVGIIVAIALLIILFGGYSFGWKWTGFVKDANFHKKTLWNWLELLIIPAVLAGGGLWFNRQQREQEQQSQIAASQQEQQSQIAASQRERELQTANSRAQDEALQAYLDQISLLLTDKERPLHRSLPGDNLGIVARARTLTVLGRLDGIRKRSLLQFLYESNLVVKGRPIIGLTGADLSRADLNNADLNNADLRGVDLTEVYLSGANLTRADLRTANLRGVDLTQIYLRKANLSWADLREANLRGVDLTWAILRGADLRGADLSGADLREANLSGAKLIRAKLYGITLMGDNQKEANRVGISLTDLVGAAVKTGPESGSDLSDADLTESIGISGETLELEALSLKGATMPNGQKYEDWLNDKEGRGEDGKGSSPS